uniref:ABC transmembrane type-1 domain-containing protein n=1 Tax=Panagrellus redivivus TaxID=6233 RepID=A0A7E4UPT0_PANRE
MDVTDPLLTDLLLATAFAGTFAFAVGFILAYPFFAVVAAIVLIFVFFQVEPDVSIKVVHQLQELVFGIGTASTHPEECEEAGAFEVEPERDGPSDKFRFARLLLTHQVPHMANYFEQRSQNL